MEEAVKAGLVVTMMLRGEVVLRKEEPVKKINELSHDR